MEMEEQYGIPDLRQYRGIFTAIPPPPQPPPHPPVELLAGHQHQHQQSLAQQHYEMVMLRERSGFHHHHQLIGLCDASATNHHHVTSNNNNSTTSNNTTTSAASGGGGVGLEMEISGGDIGGGGGNGRWPRQETLTLLDIRSSLDSKFKEANQKGPLWDEVSRIMSDEHGYQRSGKKCREKFENLYKYYKKTKEGKAGRQDGKHYRFFRQLEALYGETSNPTFPNETNLVGTNFPYNINNNSIPNKITPNPNQEPFQTPRLCDSLSLSNSSDFDTSSSEDSGNNGIMENDSIKKRKKRNWKAKIRDFIDGQMRRLMEKQEVWLEKMMKTIECKEQERISREEEWRKQESARIDREHTFWANERAWVQARDASLMEALHKITGKELRAEVRSNSIGIENGNGSEAMANVENGDRVINNYVLKMKEGGKKRKENVRGSSYFESSGSTMCNSQGGGGGAYCERGGEITGNEEGEGNSPPRDNSNVGGSGMHDSCFRFYMGDAENLWENYGLKLNKGENQ